MNAGEVRELAREWVEIEGSKTPGFLGVHLMGSLVGMPSQEPFPLWKDVDLALVVTDGSGHESERDNVVQPYKGLILEVSFHEEAIYFSPASVLANPEYTDCFARDGIILDPTGMLRALHNTVAKEWSRHQWVLARCEWEKTTILKDIVSAESDGSGRDGLAHLAHGLVYLAGLPALAALEMPTHRRCLILMRQILERMGREELFLELLNVWGVAAMTELQTEGYLEEALCAFDRAVKVHRTPIPYGFKLRPYVRPYVSEGARDMMRQGYHREAVWWIWLYHWVANAAIQKDAPEEERGRFQTGYDRLLDDMGLSTPEDWTSRMEQARALAEKVFRVADEIVATNPEIVD